VDVDHDVPPLSTDETPPELGQLTPGTRDFGCPSAYAALPGTGTGNPVASVGQDEAVTPDELLQTFHAQIRLADRDVALGWRLERVGQVRRCYPDDPAERGLIEAPEGLGDPDAAIAAERDFFAGRGQPVEWKTYTYDEPADLPDRLVAAGFVAEEPESLILGELDRIASQPSALPSKVRIRAVVTEEDFERIGDLQVAVYDESHRMSRQLYEEWQAAPDRMSVSLVEQAAGGPALTAGWVRYHPGTEFVSLWGGSTLPQWRRQGLYRALLKSRATEATERGYRYARVDASEDSRPILQRVGLLRVAGTTPYVFTP
jgi:GNAT superfamily N-acetyltransferase